MDLKKAIKDVKTSPTFKLVLGSLLAIGNFLNGNTVQKLDDNACKLII